MGLRKFSSYGRLVLIFGFFEYIANELRRIQQAGLYNATSLAKRQETSSLSLASLGDPHREDLSRFIYVSN